MPSLLAPTLGFAAGRLTELSWQCLVSASQCTPAIPVRDRCAKGPCQHRDTGVSSQLSLLAASPRRHEQTGFNPRSSSAFLYLVLNNIAFVGAEGSLSPAMPDGASVNCWGEGTGLSRSQCRKHPSISCSAAPSHWAQGSSPVKLPLPPGRLFTKGGQTRRHTGHVTED